MTLLELADRFPDEGAARRWFERERWGPRDRPCPRCGALETYRAHHVSMPYRCRACGSYFSVRTGTALASSKIPLRTWAFAIWLEATRSKGISSVQLARDVGVTQKTAWFMLHRIRAGWRAQRAREALQGPVEADETMVGGRERNKHADRRLGAAWPAGKTIVAGVRDRASGRVAATVAGVADAETIQAFVRAHAAPGAAIYTDGSTVYDGLPGRSSVRHSAGEYVRGDVHINGVESFWAVFKRAYMGTYHYMSPRHLSRYVDAFVGRHNARGLGARATMGALVRGMDGRQLRWVDLTRGDPGDFRPQASPPAREAPGSP